MDEKDKGRVPYGDDKTRRATAKARTTATADPYGMTSKNDNGKNNGNNNDRSEIQGFFASLRMTT
ncbi:MAG TPA: hypothetical protein VNY78_09300 [Edaphobacter sp.]|nr:hypothetical protein [Edaphobacter sp.]